MAREKLQRAVRTALISVLETEVDTFIGAVRYERSEQRSVIATPELTPEFAPLSRITSSPVFDNQFSLRFDMRATDNHYVFTCCGRAQGKTLMLSSIEQVRISRAFGWNLDSCSGT